MPRADPQQTTSLQTCDTPRFPVTVGQPGRALTSCRRLGSRGGMTLLCHSLFPARTASPAPPHANVWTLSSPAVASVARYRKPGQQQCFLPVFCFLSLCPASAQLSFSPAPFLQADGATERQTSLCTPIGGGKT